jgi:preprotein translocase subunit SecD
VLNGALLIAALACCGAVLTLPGIAGAVLTIGMAVDSFVLIFERIREELRAGKTASTALAAGFSKGFGTLVDTHVTTVVSCAFLLFWNARGERLGRDACDRAGDEFVYVGVRLAGGI